MKRFLVAFLLGPIFVSAYASPGRPLGHVSDFAGILKPQTIFSLEQSLINFAATNGYEISIVTIPSRPRDETIETYAVKLFEEWGIGKAKEDNGLLLLIARDDREVRIEVGYGLEPVITDIESAGIIRDILVPAFQNGDYDGGVTAAAERVMSDIRNGEPFEKPVNTPGPVTVQIIYVAFFLFMFLGSILARSKSWWAGGVIGGIIGTVFFSSLLVVAGLISAGLLFDFIVSHTYKNSISKGVRPPWWVGGGGGKGGSDGFGGFGGGMSGGGGASGRW